MGRTYAREGRTIQTRRVMAKLTMLDERQAEKIAAFQQIVLFASLKDGIKLYIRGVPRVLKSWRRLRIVMISNVMRIAKITPKASDPDAVEVLGDSSPSLSALSSHALKPSDSECEPNRRMFLKFGDFFFVS